MGKLFFLLFCHATIAVKQRNSVCTDIVQKIFSSGKNKYCAAEVSSVQKRTMRELHDLEIDQAKHTEIPS